MALLAQPKRKEKYGFDPRNTNWATDDNKFGQKLMEKMGWEKGKGLGANEDGIVEHIKASYKSDTRGLGCSPKDADAWIAHQDDFNDLLRVLNEDSSREPEKVNSSSEDPQEGRKRFYGRFARGRVQTLRSTDDLDCIMGRRKTSEPSTPVAQAANNSDDEEKDTNLKTVTSTFSVQEYFAKKMKELKSRKDASHEADERPKNLLQTSLKASVEGNNCTKTKPFYSAVCFSYNGEENSSSTSTGITKEKGWYDVDEWAVTDKQDKNGQEKKKKKKGRTTVTENTFDCENGNSNEIAKRKKKKLKAETVSCKKFEASVNERSSQLDSTNKNTEKEREFGSFLPYLEDSIERKKIKRKRTEHDACKSLEEGDYKEMNKGKKRKLKLENNLSDERQNSIGEMSLPLKSKKKETTNNTEVDTPFNEHGEKNLKKKRQKRKRREMEISDTSQHCDNQKVETSNGHSVSQVTEEANSNNSRKQRKGEEECVGNDSCLEETENKLKNKKRKKEAISAHDFSDINVKEKKEKKKKKGSTNMTDKSSAGNEFTKSKTQNILSENVEEQAEIPERKKKKKKKKMANIETTEMDDPVRKSDSNLEHGQETNKSNNSVSDDESLNKRDKNTHDDAESNIEAQHDFDLSRKMLKKKRQEKKKRRQLKKDLSDSFPGSNFGELKGYVPMIHGTKCQLY